jgi:hypothetical protein
MSSTSSTTTRLASYTISSDSNGDPVFLGALDSTGPGITKLVFSVTAVPADGSVNDFALDSLTFNTPVTTSAPSPPPLACSPPDLPGNSAGGLPPNESLKDLVKKLSATER